MNKFPQNLAGVGKGYHHHALRRVMLEPWLLSPGGVHSQMNDLVLKEVVAH
jgi:hypothetical protein